MKKPVKHSESGVVMIQVAIAMLAILGLAGFAIDVGYAYNVKGQLQHIADSASLAAIGELTSVIVALDPDDRPTHTLSSSEIQDITAAAQSVTGLHEAGNIQISLDSSDIEIGQWDFSANTLGLTATAPGAVRVTARRTTATNGPVATFFASVVGVDDISVSATATAALTAINAVEAGMDMPPIAISKHRYTTTACNQSIDLYETSNSNTCAGWHVFNEGSNSTSKLKKVIKDLRKKKYNVPAINTGDTLKFMTKADRVHKSINEFKKLYNDRRYDNSPYSEWTTTVPVYDDGDCSSWSGTTRTVSGFASVTITGVDSSGWYRAVDATIECGMVTVGAGGGSDFGVLSTISGVVE
ncbi:MAG: TadE/TadG family type IV pilus assembly protein [Myxococcota bacterium]|nr:TadE/TadG family type IV pilus assembly protein [Myxococcota bacterium]